MEEEKQEKVYSYSKESHNDDLTIEELFKNCEDKIYNNFWKNVCYEIDPEITKEIQIDDLGIKEK